MGIRFFFGLLFLGMHCIAQEEIPLYTGKIPNSRSAKNEERKEANRDVDSLTYNVSVPTLRVFFPLKGTGNGTAVIICAGGGYHLQLSKREGSDVAREFAKMGIVAFVLKYRLPTVASIIDRSLAPMQDAQQAIKLVRKNSKNWGVNANKIGIMGFSAGGHLAATAGTHFSDAKIENEESVSLRPDFMLLINPVISFTKSIGHLGSRDNLLGPKFTEDQVNYFSGELQVTPSTPPAFLVHSGADEVVSVSNSIAFYQALRANKVSAALHIYAKGEHGFLTAPSFEEWFGRCKFWMSSMNLLSLNPRIKVPR